MLVWSAGLSVGTEWLEFFLWWHVVWNISGGTHAGLVCRSLCRNIVAGVLPVVACSVEYLRRNACWSGLQVSL